MECVRVVAFQELISAHNESTSRTQYRCAIEMRIPACIDRSETGHTGSTFQISRTNNVI